MYLRELLGKRLDNPVIQQYLERFPYYRLKTDSQTSELMFEHDE
jgi:hypoxia up-regulated 1